MHATWRHTASEEWLLARRSVLTASDIKRLLTDYKRITTKKIKLIAAQQFAKVYGEKQVMVVDPMSFGPAARGHVLEPYAVGEYNDAFNATYEWWDDAIITGPIVGFSPDSLDIPQPDGVISIPSDSPLLQPAPTSLLEIKSYEAGGHFQRKAAVAAGDPIEERWQVACAMFVCPTIETGHVCFYAPQANDLFAADFTRDSLATELETINNIVELWSEFCDAMKAAPSHATKATEELIYKNYSDEIAAQSAENFIKAFY